MYKCQCNLCKNSKYNPEDFYVDLSFRTKDRPLGVSGLMRVKDEEEFVAISIDSCIDALDELIICYQKSSDSTEDILKQKQKQYPNKIKLYLYEPYIYAHNLSDEEYEYAYNLPDDSIHILSNYYNYTLSKSTYKYAIKIDADQIYFTKRLKRICNAYRNSDKMNTKLNLVERYVKRSFDKQGLNYRIPRRIIDIILRKLRLLTPILEGAILKEAIKDRSTLNLTGINVGLKDGVYGVTYSNAEIIYTFNGEGDHLLFEVTDKSIYEPFKDFIPHNKPSKKLLIEIYRLPSNSVVLQYPILWYHMRHYKKHRNENSFNITSDKEFRQNKYSVLKDTNKIDIMYHMIDLLSYLHDFDKNYYCCPIKLL